MRARFPSYVVHYKPNVQRRKVMEAIFAKEQMNNVTWILDYDKEDVS